MSTFLKQHSKNLTIISSLSMYYMYYFIVVNKCIYV